MKNHKCMQLKTHVLKKRGPKPYDWKPAFLLALGKLGFQKAAAAIAGISESTVWRARESDADFDQAYSVAEGEATAALLSEAYRRAVQGTRRLKFDSKGEPLIDPSTGKPYEEITYSDRLLELFLRARLPEFQQNTKTEVSGGLEHIVLTPKDLEDLQQRRARALRAARGEV